MTAPKDRDDANVVLPTPASAADQGAPPQVSTLPDDAAQALIEAAPDGPSDALVDEASPVDVEVDDTVPADTQPLTASGTAAFRLGFVPGVIPAKWVRTWRERLTTPLELVPVAAGDLGQCVLAGRVDAALLRLPVTLRGPDGVAVLHAIPLYEEVSVVVASKDNVLSVADEIGRDDLADDVVLVPLDDQLDWGEAGLPGQRARQRPDTTADAIALVAAGVGVLITPMSLARLHHRKDIAHAPMVGAPTSEVGLVWPAENGSPLAEELVGIVRGRSVNSSRGAAQHDATSSAETAALTKAEKDKRIKEAAARREADRKAAFARKSVARQRGQIGGRVKPKSKGPRGAR